MIGVLLEAQGESKDAEKQYRQVLAIDSHAAVAANNLAWIYVASNRQLDDALQLAQTAYQTLPDDPDVNDTLGWILYKKKLAAKALPYLEKATAKHPDEPSSHYHLGMAYVESGRVEQGPRVPPTRASVEEGLRRRRGRTESADRHRRLSADTLTSPPFRVHRAASDCSCAATRSDAAATRLHRGATRLPAPQCA